MEKRENAIFQEDGGSQEGELSPDGERPSLNIMLRSLSFVRSNIGGHQTVNSPSLLFIICLFLDLFPFYKTMHLVTQDYLPYTEIQTLPPDLPNELLTFHFSTAVFESFISAF